jgi:hypothetical protein
VIDPAETNVAAHRLLSSIANVDPDGGVVQSSLVTRMAVNAALSGDGRFLYFVDTRLTRTTGGTQ